MDEPSALRAPDPPSVVGKKLIGLEILRFAAAVAVLFSHYKHFAVIGAPDSWLPEQAAPLQDLLGWLYDRGNYGVQVFWCISGFIFFWKYHDAVAAHRVGPRKFFVLRFSRLYPLHLVTLLLVLVLQQLYHGQTGRYYVYPNNDATDFLFQLFLASEWGITRGDSFNGPIWSISLEVLVYCVFFTVLYAGGRSFRVTLGILLACLTAQSLHVRTQFLVCLGLFYAGGLAAMSFQRLHTTGYRRAGIIVATLLVAGLTGMAMFTAVLQSGHYAGFLLIYVPLLLYALAAVEVHQPWLEKTLEAGGNMTYASYLTHFPIQLAVAIYYTALGGAVPYGSVWFLVAFVLATLLAAYFIFRGFEQPAQRYLRKVLS